MGFIDRIAASAVEIASFVILSLLVILASFIAPVKTMDLMDTALALAAIGTLAYIGAKNWHSGWGESVKNAEVAAFPMLIAAFLVLTIQIVAIVKITAVYNTMNFLFALLFSVVISAVLAAILGLVFGTLGFLAGPFAFKEDRRRHMRINKEGFDVNEHELRGAKHEVKQHRIFTGHGHEILRAKMDENTIRAISQGKRQEESRRIAVREAGKRTQAGRKKSR